MSKYSRNSACNRSKSARISSVMAAYVPQVAVRKGARLAIKYQQATPKLSMCNWKVYKKLSMPVSVLVLGMVRYFLASHPEFFVFLHLSHHSSDSHLLYLLFPTSPFVLFTTPLHLSCVPSVLFFASVPAIFFAPLLLFSADLVDVNRPLGIMLPALLASLRLFPVAHLI